MKNIIKNVPAISSKSVANVAFLVYTTGLINGPYYLIFYKLARNKE